MHFAVIVARMGQVRVFRPSSPAGKDELRRIMMLEHVKLLTFEPTTVQKMVKQRRCQTCGSDIKELMPLGEMNIDLRVLQ